MGLLPSGACPSLAQAASREGEVVRELRHWHMSSIRLSLHSMYCTAQPVSVGFPACILAAHVNGQADIFAGPQQHAE